MEKRTEQIEESIGYLDMERELKRLRKYEELTKFLFECDEINLMIKMYEYIMDAEEAFNLMDEYNRTGELPLSQHTYDYE
jgi:glycyl-tRNA synthetase alpha subunit